MSLSLRPDVPFSPYRHPAKVPIPRNGYSCHLHRCEHQKQRFPAEPALTLLSPTPAQGAGHRQASRILPIVFGSAAVLPTERSGLWQAHESPRQGLRCLDFAWTTDVRGIDMGRASPGEATGGAVDGISLT